MLDGRVSRQANADEVLVVVFPEANCSVISINRNPYGPHGVG